MSMESCQQTEPWSTRETEDPILNAPNARRERKMPHLKTVTTVPILCYPGRFERFCHDTAAKRRAARTNDPVQKTLTQRFPIAQIE
ncbi:MAG: hypothetical protein HQL91_12170 [Magnetococcales bacterium]|nr:hypothetical protein [Magnetococcales bacterium]